MQGRRDFLRRTGGLLLLGGVAGASGITGIGCGGGGGEAPPDYPTPRPLPYYPPAEFPSSPTRGQEWTNPKDGSVMIWVPGGTFQMGTNTSNEHLKFSRPQHTVTVSGFWMAKYEVTYGQFKRYAKEVGVAITDDYYFTDEYRDPITREPKDNYPMGGPWEEAIAYANWAGMTLPTEAQWEYAATGGDGRRFPWGNDWDPSRGQFDKKLPTDVGSFPSGVSPFGMYDMAGNVWEWCRDWFDSYPSTAQTDPAGPSTDAVKVRQKVFRGGSHQGAFLEQHWAVYRSADHVLGGSTNWGFRMASRP